MKKVKILSPRSIWVIDPDSNQETVAACEAGDVVTVSQENYEILIEAKVAEVAEAKAKAPAKKQAAKAKE